MSEQAAAAEPLRQLQARMEAAGLAAYVVPSADPHQSEYVPACWQRRAHVSGFKGSMGTLVVLAKEARLWADSRYWLAAERELFPGIELMRQGTPEVPEPGAWLARALRPGDRVGVDPQLLSEAQWSSWQRELAAGEVKLEAIEPNWVDLDWAARPPLPGAPLRALAIEFTGRSSAEKLAQLRGELAQARCVAHVVPALDAVAWLFNVRGADVDHNPLAVSYAIATQDTAQLFIDPAKLGPALREHLAGVELHPYEQFGAALRELAARGSRVWLDPELSSHWIAQQLRAGGAQLYEASSPLRMAKAVKNPTELAGIRAAHVRDGAALVRFLSWLEASLAAGAVLDEIDCSDKLESLRAEQEHYQGTSFTTISGYAANGAIVHYRPDRTVGCAQLQPRGLYLVDSGGQYLDGTTDVTRTLALGPITESERTAFTLVLRGHIAVATALFPEGTIGAQLDALARRPLWEHGLDYGHGTGHGVGHFLCVHEGPVNIAPRGFQALRAGMVLSNEPGFYRDGAFGIRIENLVEVVERGARDRGRRFFGFEDLTLCPIDLRCIDAKLLSDAERGWVDAYHARVREALAPLLHGAAERRWLEEHTRPL